ncbi:MAG: hypothetical protein HY291_18170 [Planctomycetes bacterium]|nr:hypothetical protein [Planctomycetota bacterium]
MNTNSEPKTLKNTGEEKLHPVAAAVALRKFFRKTAKKLAPKDRAMQEDLAQEMALAVLQCKRPAARKFFCTLGEWRAKDFLRRYGDPAGGTLEDIMRREEAENERAAKDEEDPSERVLELLGVQA